MKNLIIMLTLIFAINASAKTTITTVSNDKLCKLFTQKAQAYKVKTSDRHDVYAAKTLASYEKRSKQFCSK